MRFKERLAREAARLEILARATPNQILEMGHEAEKRALMEAHDRVLRDLIKANRPAAVSLYLTAFGKKMDLNLLSLNNLVTDTLLAYACDIDRVSEKMISPEIVQILLDNKADPNIKIRYFDNEARQFKEETIIENLEKTKTAFLDERQSMMDQFSRGSYPMPVESMSWYNGYIQTVALIDETIKLVAKYMRPATKAKLTVVAPDSPTTSG